jgi:peptide/nickel transport system ATP-binding protein
MAGSGTAHLHGTDDVLLSVEHLVVEYKAGHKGRVKAVSDVSFDVRRGETLGLVGESGCGKSTTGRATVMLERPTSGSVVYDGAELQELKARPLRTLRGKLQIIFQDPISSLNPRRTVRKIVAEGLRAQKTARPYTDRVDEVLTAVGLDPEAMGDRHSRELSGGQCQRVAIARALVLEPDLIVCDEPVSALDVSVQAQILNLIQQMKVRYGLTLLFISHDLAVVKNVSDRVAVMYLGKICEVAPAESLYESPEHPYTEALISAIPNPDPFAVLAPLEVSGELPSPIDPPSGCRFRTRCPRAQERCALEEPTIRAVGGPEHFVACHFPNAEIGRSGSNSAHAVPVALAGSKGSTP